MTTILPADDEGIAAAVAAIVAGEPVALPTETVYGLAADATDGAAVARVYAAKGRPAFNPLIVHVEDAAAADRIAPLGDAALLADAFWPGPLTLVLRARADARIAGIVTAGLPTIALRVPAHPVMRAVLAASGRPLAAPSANASGTISATRAAHVAASLDGRVRLVIDGGATSHGLESTIVAIGRDGLRLLRPGPIAAEALAEAVGLPIVTGGADGAIQAPGQLASHYAPRLPLRLNAIAGEGDEWLIGFDAIAGDDTLSASGDLVEAAARLFDALHRADASGRARIAVAPVPATGLGVAIRDRLARAAAPRPYPPAAKAS